MASGSHSSANFKIPNVNVYLTKLVSDAPSNVKIESLFEELNGTHNEVELYYFEFKSEWVTYSEITGRIQEIKLKFGRIP